MQYCDHVSLELTLHWYTPAKNMNCCADIHSGRHLQEMFRIYFNYSKPDSYS
jgi:hypothetical protein